MDGSKIYGLPKGVQNYLPEECYNKNLIEEKLFGEFRLWGYERIETAPLEFYDNFREGCFRMDGARMFKFGDTDGNLVVLTPDITVPIARIAARQPERPLRYCYGGNVFDNYMNVHTGSRVQSQAGVELMGVEGSDADTEVMALAIESLKRAGLKDFKVDIGEVNFFKGILAEYGIDEAGSEAVRQTVERKNMLGVKLQLDAMDTDAEAYTAVCGILSLFGGTEVLDRADKMCKSHVSRAALENLQKVAGRLCEYGFGDCISIDLGMVQRTSYYSGIVFQGLSRYIGAPLMTGGRYDGLADVFGVHLPATGFAVDIKKLMIALECQGSLEKPPACGAAVASLAGAGQTFDYVMKLRKSGTSVVQAYCKSPDELRNFMAARGIKKGVFIDRGGKAAEIGGVK